MASQQWTEDVEPGDATLTRHEDGTVTVQHADPVLAVDPELDGRTMMIYRRVQR